MTGGKIFSIQCFSFGPSVAVGLHRGSERCIEQHASDTQTFRVCCAVCAWSLDENDFAVNIFPRHLFSLDVCMSMSTRVNAVHKIQ